MRVLFLTHRLPYAPNRGDRIRAYYLMREMARFAEVSLFSLVHDDEEAAQAARVPFAQHVMTARVPRIRNLILGAARLGSDRPLTLSLLNSPDVRPSLDRLVRDTPPDIVLAYCSSMARFALEPPLTGRPLVLDMVDVDSVKWKQLGAETAGPRGWVYRREAVTLRKFEARAVRSAHSTLVVSERERDVLLQIAPGTTTHVIPPGVEIEAFAPPSRPVDSPVVIFCGVMNYAPNEEGVRWFAEDIWPRIRAARADARFIVVGSHPTDAVRALAAKDSSIEVTGRVAEVQPFLWKSAVSVAPLRLARGMQTKVLEALAAGLPVVAVPGVFAGLPPGARAGCVAADQPADFADAVLRLLAASPDERRRHASQARLDELQWHALARPLEGILQAAIDDGRRRAGTSRGN